MTQTAISSLRTDTMRVPVTNGQFVEFGAAEIALIAAARDRANVARQRGEARTEVMIIQGLQRDLAGRIGVPQSLIYTALAAVKTDDLYVTEFKGEPTSLDLAVQWDRGWKTYKVGGTRHAYYLLRKLAGYEGFQGARLNDVIVGDDGYQLDNVISFDLNDITGSDRFGKYRALLDRNNAHYDLEK